jgi:ATP-binding cassette, subfamily B, bacterial MsbA
MNDTTHNEKLATLSSRHVYTGFKVLFRYLALYKKQITILSIIGILSAIGNGTIPYLAGIFFDSILVDTTVRVFGYVLPLYVGLLLAWIIVQAITYVIDWRINRMSEYLSNTVWTDYIAKSFGFLFELPLSFHKKNKIGEITTKINIAGNALETITGKIIITLTPQLLSIIIALSIAYYMKPLLAVFLLVGMCAYILTLIKSVGPLGDLNKGYWTKIGDAFGDAFDAVGNTHAIKQATAEKYEQDKIRSNMKNALPLYLRQTLIWSNLTLYQRITILLTQTAIFILSIIYIRQGMMTLGELIAFNAYAAMVFTPFVSIAQNWQTIHAGMISLEEAEHILSITPETYEPEDAVKVDVVGNIAFEHASFSYEEGKKVLQDISFSAKAGEVVALVGESGVGKSTLIDLISGYHFPSTGTVFIDGHDIRTLDLNVLRSQIAVVPQEVVLFNDTIKTNIRYGSFNATDEEIEIAARKAHTVEFIEKFPAKWEQLVGERGVKLSVGQKQRIAIARAILRNPKILILDEPTSALDAGSEKIISDSFDELMKHRTTFVVAHRLSTVRKADRILVFKEGSIIEQGTHAELLTIEGGEYRRLYELQIGFSE